MTLIDPHRFTPFETGNPTSVTLPGLHRNTHVDVMRITPDLVLSHSHFSPSIRHCDDIRRSEEQLILTFNLSGRMQLIDPQGSAHEISGGEGWIIRSGGSKLRRIVEKGDGCSNLVIALTVSRLPPVLTGMLTSLLQPNAPFRRLHLPVPGKATVETLLDRRTDPVALLRKEGQCLSLIGHALEELATAPDHAIGDNRLLISRVTAFLSENLVNPVTMSEIADEFGKSHVTLNQMYRAATGMTVFGHLRSLRLEAAERLIRHTERSLTEIAAECGFSDASHLANAFRKRHNMTASNWRRQVGKKS